MKTFTLLALGIVGTGCGFGQIPDVPPPTIDQGGTEASWDLTHPGWRDRGNNAGGKPAASNSNSNNAGRRTPQASAAAAAREREAANARAKAEAKAQADARAKALRDKAAAEARRKAEQEARAAAATKDANARAAVAAAAAWSSEDRETAGALDDIFATNVVTGGTREVADHETESLVLREQEEYESRNAAWMELQRKLIDERAVNPYLPKFLTALKDTKPPPPLPDRKYEMLQPGDVLLVSPARSSFWSGFGSSLINAGDVVTSTPPLGLGNRASQSPASHTVLFLREEKGRKLFLDHTPGEGTRVISEAEFLKRYGHRETLVAQPINPPEAAAVWEATRKLVQREQQRQASLPESTGTILNYYFRDSTGFGLYGEDNMVCSEADRWILVNSGAEIPETASPLKRLLGIHYGPANFFSDEKNFLITPLYAVPAGTAADH